MSALIRPLEAADAEVYFAHRRAALHAEPLAFASSPEDDVASSIEAVREILSRAPESVVLGAFATGALVGSVGVVRDAKRKRRHVAGVFGMYVEDEHRGRGIGRALLAAAIAHARTLAGLRRLQLGVSESAEAACHLYEQAGFRRWGTEIDALVHGGRSVAEHHMVLELGEG